MELQSISSYYHSATFSKQSLTYIRPKILTSKSTNNQHPPTLLPKIIPKQHTHTHSLSLSQIRELCTPKPKVKPNSNTKDSSSSNTSNRPSSVLSALRDPLYKPSRKGVTVS
ncbi:hypothetical protein DL95DRAFT_120084 [Leptodontidium sp. 2 PMI_412]|nr:hypothetical protein DL95DRAFT_120084 [Leptodontidium sp. 2 PMI_412]